MAEIKVLDNGTIDKIAAGEVVERPASVVKELVENAIDAGAAAVTVEIKDGGISLIRITDNGMGIKKEQVAKAFLRHATSKIRAVEDLAACRSLGFRGEALSSIASVSMVEMITKTGEALTGSRYLLEGGVEKGMEDVGAPEGTTILIRNLFFNTPARRKFLKTPQTEGSYVSDLCEHMALSHPEIAFKYMLNGQVRFHTSGNGDLKEIIYRIYGKDVMNELLPISCRTANISLEGFLGKPAVNRANRNFENYFVNHRYVKSDIIAKAIEEGYRPYLMQHKFPFVVLHIGMDQDKLDVNVHPSKMEVRFSGQNEIYGEIADAVSAVLSEKELIPSVSLVTRSEKEAQKKTAPAPRVPEPFETKRILADRVCETPAYAAADSRPPENTPIGEGAALSAGEIHKVIGGSQTETPVPKSVNTGIIKAGGPILIEKPVQLDFFDEKLLTKEARTEYKLLGQIFSTYWLVAFHDKLFIVDQHAAHEKVKYEQLLSKIKEHKVTSQILNPPVIVTLSSKEEEIWKLFAEYFLSMGFEIEAFGGSEYAIRCVPTDLYGCNEKELFINIMDELTENTLTGVSNVIEEKLASMACKSAVKGNNSLSALEMEQLLDQLLELDNPYHCPHGRPTIVSMSKYEIDKKFKRVL